MVSELLFYLAPTSQVNQKLWNQLRHGLFQTEHPGGSFWKISDHVTSLFRTLGCLLFSFGVKAEALKITFKALPSTSLMPPQPHWLPLSSLRVPGPVPHSLLQDCFRCYLIQDACTPTHLNQAEFSFVLPTSVASMVNFSISLYNYDFYVVCLSHKSDCKLLQGGDHTLLFGLFL